MIITKNKEIRDEAKRRGVALWKIADELGINDGNFSRKLRHELTADEKEKILVIINRLSRSDADA